MLRGIMAAIAAGALQRRQELPYPVLPVGMPWCFPYAAHWLHAFRFPSCYGMPRGLLAFYIYTPKYTGAAGAKFSSAMLALTHELDMNQPTLIMGERLPQPRVHEQVWWMTSSLHAALKTSSAWEARGRTLKYTLPRAGRLDVQKRGRRQPPLCIVH